MPYMSGQKMFANVFHTGILILAQSLLCSVGIVLILGRTFQQDAVFPGDLEYIPVHFSLERDAFGLLQVVRLFEVIYHFGEIAQSIGDMKAEIIGIFRRIILDRMTIVDMRDDGHGLTDFLTGGGDGLISSQVTHKTNEDGYGYCNENQYDNVEFLHNRGQS